MWSHTIESSKTKAPPPAHSVARTPTSPTKPLPDPPSKDESLIQSFDADGFSKTSRVHTSKKPVTVAKAPILGRTPSTRAERQLADTKHAARSGLEKRGSRVAPPATLRALAGTPVRGTRTGTPTTPASKTSRAGAGTPVRGTRTATPTSPTSRTPRVGTSAQPRPRLRDPKFTVDTKGRDGAAISQPNKSALVSKYAKQDLPIQEEDGVGERDTKEEDEQVREASVAETDTILEPDYVNVSRPPSPEEDRNKEDSTTNGDAAELTRQESNDSQQTPAKEEAELEAHEELNREIALRNETIRKLRREIGFLQTAHERKVENLEAASSEQMKALGLELDSVGETLVDLDDKYRSTVKSHEEILRSKNEEIEKISSDAPRASR
ncbi:hypothetical protein ABVK25_000022 [Lepraria finkii]|uniref:Uncharacterized protein n=1 Tax=Lepraria finkii TaxID=1340010 RepID=A0ABR4BNZ7_9LECA